MAKDKYADWTSVAIRKKTARLIEQLAGAISRKEKRLTRCSKSEAVHIAVLEHLHAVKSSRNR